MAASVEYTFVLQADGIKPDNLPDFKVILNKEFGNLYDLQCHPSVKTRYFIHHKNKEVAAYLLSEQFLWIDSVDRVTFCLPNNDSSTIAEDIDRKLHAINLKDDEESNIKIYRNNSRQSLKTAGSSNDSGFPEKSKMDCLKTYERELLHKIKLIDHVEIPELTIKQKSSIKPPVLMGSYASITTAENRIFKYLRTLIQEELNLIDMLDKTKQSLVYDKIVSVLQVKFLNDPVVFEKKASCIVIHSPDTKHIDSVKKYATDNFKREFVPIKEEFKIKYMETNLSKQLTEMAASKDFINIFAEKTLQKQGCVIFGNKQDVDSIKIELERLIESIDKTETILNMHSISEEAEIMMAGLESKLNVKVTVCHEEKKRVGSPNSALIEGVLISLVAGKIEDQKVDVIVCSTGQKLQLESGPIAKAISMKAGPELQKECTARGDINIGEVREAKGYNLPCKCIFLCRAKDWNEVHTGECQKVLKEIVLKCLEEANKKQCMSIAFPPIACGILKMPARFSAESIFDAIENYEWSREHTLKEIKLVIFDSNNDIYLAYQKCLESKLNKSDSLWKSPERIKVSIVGPSKVNQRACKSLQSTFLK